MKTYYCHLSQLLASRGTVVSRGSMIGRVGSTGRSTSPHLHFVVSLYGRAVNPRDYLP
jgi:murein DD-endopeptidase MepM/ murein hydrolase activator NlpD